MRILKGLRARFDYKKGNGSELRIQKDVAGCGSREQGLGQRKNKEVGEAEWRRTRGEDSMD